MWQSKMDNPDTRATYSIIYEELLHEIHFIIDMDL